eukprot:766267-Hanusia_phi.AAC.3
MVRVLPPSPPSLLLLPPSFSSLPPSPSPSFTSLPPSPPSLPFSLPPFSLPPFSFSCLRLLSQLSLSLQNYGRLWKQLQDFRTKVRFFALLHDACNFQAPMSGRTETFDP